MSDLVDHIHRVSLETLDAIPDAERAGIYAVSFLVYDEEDDPRRPTLTIGFNTEKDVPTPKDPPDPWAPEPLEARWNFAFWRQNELASLCSSYEDRVGVEFRDRWARENGLWYDLANDEDALFNPRGEPLTSAFVQLLVTVVQRLHRDGDITRIFGRRVPVLIHELEYYDEIATQNLAANPFGVVPEDFVRWCRS